MTTRDDRAGDMIRQCSQTAHAIGYSVQDMGNAIESQARSSLELAQRLAGIAERLSEMAYRLQNDLVAIAEQIDMHDRPERGQP